MKTITLGKTGIRTPQNAFGALPIQRISRQEAVRLLRMAHDGGMTFFDTARAYTDSEEKVGEAFDGIRDRVFIASKTMAVTGVFHKTVLARNSEKASACRIGQY